MARLECLHWMRMDRTLDRGYALPATSWSSLKKIFEIFYLREMQRHVRVQHKFHHQRPELLVLLLGQVLQDIALIVNHRPEERRHVMILEDALVIIHHGKVWCWLDVEVVCCPGVVIVVDDGGQEETEYLQVWHPVLQPGLGDDPVTALQHVSCVQVVVVRVAMTLNIL